MSDTQPPSPPRKPRTPVKQVIREVTEPGLVHPALIPGIGVERTGKSFSTNWAVFAIAGAFVAGVIVWGVVAPDSVRAVGTASLTWVTVNFGWLFGALTIAVAVFMLFIGYGRTGGVRLGMDDEEPEYSTVSWVAMLFSAGLGIGLLFYGPMEPLTYFLDQPHGFVAEPGTVDAMHTALAQTMLHWGPMAWAYYALVGGAIAYAAYRRGRSPLISAIFTPIFGQRTEGWLGSIVDIFAIVVTLGGLQSLMVVTALPFAIVVMGVMLAWAKDLRTDPYMLRRKYAKAAIAQGVRLGIEEHGDDFVFGSSGVVADDGAGAWLDTEDPALTEWWTDAASGPVSADDVLRTLEPGRIQRRGPERPDHTASGDASLTVGEERHEQHHRERLERRERARREREARRHPEGPGERGEPGVDEPRGDEPRGDEPRH